MSASNIEIAGGYTPTTAIVSTCSRNERNYRPYVDDGGYYEVSVAEVEAGPYTPIGTTADKRATGYVARGLEADKTYYFRVRTFTSAHQSPWMQQNDLWSDYTEPVSAYLPIIALTKTGPAWVPADGPIRYTLTIANNSATETFTNLVLTDGIPAGASYVSGGNRTGDLVEWSIPSLAPGTTTQVELVVTASAPIVNDTYSVQDVDGHSATGAPAVSTQVGASVCQSVSEIPPAECQALVALYASTSGDSWIRQWWLTDPPCTWYGVSCVSGHVQSLDLAGNNLSGSMPPELGSLTSLQRLNLGQNFGLSGPIPPELQALSSLQVIKLFESQVNGPIPAWLGNISTLQEIDLSNTDFSGPIPAGLGSLPNLRELFLGSWGLTGLIPTELGSLPKLQRLRIIGTSLSGPIPPQLGNLSELGQLELVGNYQLGGPIPPELGNLSKLANLGLISNQLNGPIPSQLANLTQLGWLNLYGNQLSGPIPDWLANMHGLWTIMLGGNQFSGSIPTWLGGLTNLCQLALDDNRLTGPIPAELGSLSNLWWLDLGYNALWADASTPLSFLNEKAPGWDQTQTIAPADLQAASSADGVQLSWTPILYTGDGGYYEVSYATVSGGPYTVHGTTSDKATTGYTVIALQPGSYYFRVRTYTLMHGWQQKGLWSDYTPSVSAAVVPQGSSVTVEPDEPATLTLPESSGEISFPAGAVASTTIIVYDELDAPSQGTGSFALGNWAFTLEATDGGGEPVTTFAELYMIILHYEDADWQGIDESTLNLYYWNGSAWTAVLPCAGCSLDIDTNTLVAVLDHLTEFALLGQYAVPAVGNITALADPVPVNVAVQASADFTNSGVPGTHMATWDWGDSTTSAGVVTEANGAGSVSGSHTYTAAGVYTVKLTVTNAFGGAGESVLRYVVVYDASAGFVTGGGWINSPAGAYVADPTLTGKATFGFVAKYQKGAKTPSGNTEFQFKAGDHNFRSDAYDWLVVAGAKAQFKGTGTINGSGDYGFLLSATDGEVRGGGGVDKFRIKIWDKVTGNIVYDNQMGAGDDAEATTVIQGGSIIIHAK